ncbi:chemokine XC receptor 1-like [Lampris incognitus]|uniref:chemokine XC receptor 1-like n=1 Tax=Lampris incognitus TaxID=2546036 RepID=UPI0024B4EDAB|nr:chemokine XC receptor 1-like [Lampris incognitus]
MELSPSAESCVSEVFCNYTVNDTYDYDEELEYTCAKPNTESISAAFFLVIFILGMTGNGILLGVLVRYEDLKVVTNLFVLNLALSDLVFTLTLPFWATYYLSHWVFGDFACKLVTAAYAAGLYSSVILLTAMTLDRFTKVVLRKWLSEPRKRRWCAVAACAAAWLISVAVSVREAVHSRTLVVEVDGEPIYTCEAFAVDPGSTDVRVRYYLKISFLFFLPFVIVSFCYSAILRTICLAVSRKKQRTVLVALCVVVTFFICWAPYNIMVVVQIIYVPQDCDAVHIFNLVLDVCKLLAYSHCCMNPMLYMLSKNFRKHLLSMFRCENTRQTRSERDNVPSRMLTAA